MYQFTTTTIINSNLDSNGVTPKYSGDANAFIVTRVNTFKKANIVSVYKRAYSAGVKEVAKVTVPVIAAGTVARLTVDVRLSQQTDSEYANTYLYFKKPVVIEIIASGTAATDATAFKNQLIALKDRFGFAYITATTSGADIILTATNNNQRFFSATIEKEKASTNSIILPEYENVTAGTFSVTTPGKIGFGDDEYMIKSLMIPTLENTRYFGINKEERPILGGNYTEFVIRYSVDKVDDGIVTGLKSITTHVFYVKSDLVAAFETEILKTVDTLTSLSVSAVDTALSLSTDTTEALVVTGAIGSVTYATSNAAVATVAAGTVTAVGAGSATITVTDAAGNTASIDFTVTA